MNCEVILDLWGSQNIRGAEYFVFHDESVPSKQWLLIGLVFVARKHLSDVQAILRKAREMENYYGEIHFSALPKSLDSVYTRKARVALRWMEAFQNGLAEHANFSCLAVDRRSPKYEHWRFRAHFHAYNRFTAMALKAGIAWHLGHVELDELRIRFVSDAKDRQSRPDKGLIDNFEEYLPYRAELDAYLSQSKNRSYPSVRLELELRNSAEDDLLQFCDLLLGATQMALVAGSDQPAKRALGQMVVRWCQDLRRPLREQRYNLYHKFNIWAFPDNEGRPYNNVPLALPPDDVQLPLFA